MSKAEELAQIFSGFRQSSHRTADKEPLHEAAAAELRRLAQVERELEALKASIGEPVAIIGRDYQLLWARQDWSEGLEAGAPLYAIKEVNNAKQDSEGA